MLFNGGSGCVWSCCFVVCLAEVCCRGRSASAGRIVEAHRTHFLRRPWSLPGQPRQNLDGAGGACLGGLGIDDRGSQLKFSSKTTVPRELQLFVVPIRWSSADPGMA